MIMDKKRAILWIVIVVILSFSIFGITSDQVNLEYPTNNSYIVANNDSFIFYLNYTGAGSLDTCQLKRVEFHDATTGHSGSYLGYRSKDYEYNDSNSRIVLEYDEDKTGYILFITDDWQQISATDYNISQHIGGNQCTDNCVYSIFKDDLTNSVFVLVSNSSSQGEVVEMTTNQSNPFDYVQTIGLDEFQEKAIAYDGTNYYFLFVSDDDYFLRKYDKTWTSIETTNITALIENYYGTTPSWLNIVDVEYANGYWYFLNDDFNNYMILKSTLDSFDGEYSELDNAGVNGFFVDDNTATVAQGDDDYIVYTRENQGNNILNSTTSLTNNSNNTILYDAFSLAENFNWFVTCNDSNSAIYGADIQYILNYPTAPNLKNFNPSEGEVVVRTVDSRDFVVEWDDSDSSSWNCSYYVNGSFAHSQVPEDIGGGNYKCKYTTLISEYGAGYYEVSVVVTDDTNVNSTGNWNVTINPLHYSILLNSPSYSSSAYGTQQNFNFTLNYTGSSTIDNCSVYISEFYHPDRGGYQFENASASKYFTDFWYNETFWIAVQEEGCLVELFNGSNASDWVKAYDLNCTNDYSRILSFRYNNITQKYSVLQEKTDFSDIIFREYDLDFNYITDNDTAETYRHFAEDEDEYWFLAYNSDDSSWNATARLKSDWNTISQNHLITLLEDYNLSMRIAPLDLEYDETTQQFYIASKISSQSEYLVLIYDKSWNYTGKYINMTSATAQPDALWLTDNTLYQLFRYGAFGIIFYGDRNTNITIGTNTSVLTNGTSNIIQGTLPDNGNYFWGVTCTDANGYVIDNLIGDQFAFTSNNYVQEITYNNPSNMDFSIAEPNDQTFTINWSDADNTSIIYLWIMNGTTVSSGVTSDEQINYTFSGNYSSEGIYNITARVVDGINTFTQINWTMTVNNTIPNTALNISAYSPSSLEFSIAEPNNQTFSVDWIDAENSTILYYWYRNGSLITSGQDSTGTVEYNKTGNYYASNIYNISVIVSDGEFNKTVNWTMTVNESNSAPNIINYNVPQEFSIPETSSQTFSVDWSDIENSSTDYYWYINGTLVESGTENTTVMWVTNQYSNSTTKVEPDGTMTNYTGTGDSPFGITFDGTNIWITNSYGDGGITKVLPNGSMINYSTGTTPYEINFDGTNIWIANLYDDTVTKIEPDLTMTNYSGMGESPNDVAFDGLNIWTANLDSSSVTKINPEGYMTNYTGITFAYALASDGVNMWIANFIFNRVTKLEPDGSTTTYSSTGSTTVDIAFDGINMWTVNSNGQSVSKVEPDGTITTYPGTGEFPFGIAFDGVNMWTANQDSDGVTKVEPDGTLTNYTGAGEYTTKITSGGFIDKYTFTGNYSASGSYNVTFVVSDGESNDTYTWIMNLTDEHSSPVIANYTPVNANISISEPNDQLFTVNWTDVDEDISQALWYRNGTLVKNETGTNYNSTYTFEGNYSTDGVYNITVIIDDGYSTVDSQQWILEVNDSTPTASLTEDSWSVSSSQSGNIRTTQYKGYLSVEFLDFSTAVNYTVPKSRLSNIESRTSTSYSIDSGNSITIYDEVDNLIFEIDPNLPIDSYIFTLTYENQFSDASGSDLSSISTSGGGESLLTLAVEDLPEEVSASDKYELDVEIKYSGDYVDTDTFYAYIYNSDDKLVKSFSDIMKISKGKYTVNIDMSGLTEGDYDLVIKASKQGKLATYRDEFKVVKTLSIRNLSFDDTRTKILIASIAGIMILLIMIAFSSSSYGSDKK